MIDPAQRNPSSTIGMLGAVVVLVLGVAPLFSLAPPKLFAQSTSPRPTDQPASTGGDARSIVIGSKNFTESRLLAEIMAQLLEARTDLRVERRVNLGGTIVVNEALKAGQIDLYPEYTGTAWAAILQNSEAISDPLETWVRVSQAYQERFDLEWLAPFGFSNSYVLALDESLAAKWKVTRISGLAAHAAELRVGVSHEFLKRADGYPGLSKAYGFELPKIRGMEHGIAYEAIASKRVDLIDVYNTDGKLLSYSLRLLEDDRGFFPPYDAAPVARRDTLRLFPEIKSTLNALAFQINAATMRRLNHEVEKEEGDFAVVARRFLVESSLLEKTQADRNVDAPSRGLLGLIFSNAMLRHLGQHALLTSIAVLLAILVSVPLGIWLTRHDRWAGPFLGAAGVIQTIPSIALLAFMIPIPFLGLGGRAAVAALFLYALLPILRNTVAGIREVDPELVDAARGMGLRDREILTRIELPLAARTIMAGIRTSTVISVGVATLAAFVGAGGLGDPIFTGLQLGDMTLVLSGAFPAAVLAIFVDFALGRVERRLVPRGLADA